MFFGALLVRVVIDLVFFVRHGWFSSHLIEVWFYYGVARGVFPLSALDPTFGLLRLPGLVLPDSILYQATVFTSALVSALTAFFIYGWLRRRDGLTAGIAGGIIFALLPAPLTLCLVNFSHDLVAIPLIVLFFRAVQAIGKRGKRRVPAALAALLLLLLGLTVGPLMAGAMLAVLVSTLWPLFRSRFGRPEATLPALLYLVGLIILLGLLYLLLKPNLLNWLAPLALRFRGIDLTAQMIIQVGDLQPLPPDAFWNRYTLFVFLLPWGLWTAFKRRDFFALALFLVSLVLSLVVNRSARLLDLSVVLLTSLALVGWKSPAKWVTAGWALLLLLENLVAPAVARAVYLAIPPMFSEVISGAELPPDRLRFVLILGGFFVLGLVGPFLFRRKKSWIFSALLIPVALLQALWVLEAARTSSDEVEYRVYRSLDRLARPGAKIFAAWNQGYFIGAVTDLVPVTTPERIDLSLSRLYWEEEEDAVRELRRRGVSYVHVCSRYFGITRVNPKTDTFGMRGSTIIGPRPDHIRRFSRMRQTLLFRMIYEPESLRHLEPVLEEIDPDTRLLVRVFALESVGGP